MARAKSKQAEKAASGLLAEEQDKVLAALGAVEAMKGERPILFDLTIRTTFTDYILICHGTSDRHVDAIAEGVNQALKARGHMPLGIEGRDKAQWVLLDFGGLIVHVFHEPIRDFYDVEGLWADCPQLDIPKLLDLTKAAAPKKRVARAKADETPVQEAAPKRTVAKKAPAKKAAEKEAVEEAPKRRAVAHKPKEAATAKPTRVAKPRTRKAADA